MVVKDGFKSHLLEIIADERAKKAELERQLNIINGRLAALDTILAIYEGDLPVSQKASEIVSAEELRANVKKVPEALKFIAERNEGIVHYRDARDLVVAAGLSRGKSRSVASYIHTIMHRSDEWERVSPGKFRLIKN